MPHKLIHSLHSLPASRTAHYDNAFASVSDARRLIDKIVKAVAEEFALSFVEGHHRAILASSLYVRYTISTVQLSFEDALIEVWRQCLVQNASTIQIGESHYSVRRTPKRGLREIDFVFDGREIRGLEQNPDTKSRWAQMARSGKKVMQFLSDGRYVANVVDGKATIYGGPAD